MLVSWRVKLSRTVDLSIFSTWWEKIHLHLDYLMITRVLPPHGKAPSSFSSPFLQRGSCSVGCFSPVSQSPNILNPRHPGTIPPEVN